MSDIYTTNSISKGYEVKLCKSKDPKYLFAILINGILKAKSIRFRDAYILYNEFAR